jgi:hypothetical protein
MNERIQELVKQAGDYVNEVYTPPVRSKTPGKIWEDGHIGWNTQFNEKFAELIVLECAACCGSQADMRNIRKRFGLPVESNIKYPSPDAIGHYSQYGREYNIPKE